MGVVVEIEWVAVEEIAAIGEIEMIEVEIGHSEGAIVAAMKIGQNRDVHLNAMREEAAVASEVEGAVALEVVGAVVSEEEVVTVTRLNQNGGENHRQWETKVSVVAEEALFPVEGPLPEEVADFLEVLSEGSSRLFLKDRNL